MPYVKLHVLVLCRILYSVYSMLCTPYCVLCTCIVSYDVYHELLYSCTMPCTCAMQCMVTMLCIVLCDCTMPYTYYATHFYCSHKVMCPYSTEENNMRYESMKNNAKREISVTMKEKAEETLAGLRNCPNGIFRLVR